MNKPIAAAVLCLLSRAAWGDETRVDSRIDSADLFKNGLAVVHRTVHLPGPGVYRVEDVARAVHGTYWVESDLPVDGQVTTRVVEDADVVDGPVDFQQDLAGQPVLVRLKGKESVPVEGKIVVVKPAPVESKGFAAATADRYGYYRGEAQPAGAQFLLLDTPTGRTYLDKSEIASVEAKGGGAAKHRKPVLLLTVGPDAKQGGDVHIEYLAPGLGWAPAYRVKLVDATSFTVRQQAVVKNEMTDLADVDVNLITGFPQVKFASVTSPLVPGQTWDEFFRQISAESGGTTNYGFAGNVVAQSAARDDTGVAPPAAGAAGDTADLHYESIGHRSLTVGDALLATVATGKGTYARVVQWHVRDRSNEQRYGGQAPPPADDAWDAVRLVNPLAIPMTTGPVEIIDGGKFAGQSSVDFTNPGQSAVIKITKALSVETHSTVAEDPKTAREPAKFWWGNYVWVTLDGELTYTNHRPVPVTLEIDRDISGEPTSADGSPSLTTKADSVQWSQREFTWKWTVTVKPGETGSIKYRYKTLQPG